MYVWCRLGIADNLVLHPISVYQRLIEGKSVKMVRLSLFVAIASSRNKRGKWMNFENSNNYLVIPKLNWSAVNWSDVIVKAFNYLAKN